MKWLNCWACRMMTWNHSTGTRSPNDSPIDGFDRAIVTLGASGSVVIENGRWHRVSAAQVNAVDTTGCGDSFMGTVLAGLAAGHTLLQSAQIGSYVSAYAATKLGAQSAYGTAEEVIAYFS